MALPNVPSVLTETNVVPGLSNNKVLTSLDMLKDMFRVSGTKIANSTIAREILKSFGANNTQPAAEAIDHLTVNMSLWESSYKKKLTDFIELYAKERGISTTHRFFYKKNVALTTECRLPGITRFVSDVGYDPGSINAGAISLVGHGSTIDNGPRAHFEKNAKGQIIIDGSLELFPPPDQELDMSSLYSGMDHICVTVCKYLVDQNNITHTIINAVISGQNVLITILRNLLLPVSQNFVSATYTVNGGPPVNWNPATEGDICAPNDDKNKRANVNVTTGGLQINDFIRILLKFLGDEALCITTFIADRHFSNIRAGRVAVVTGDGMLRLRCLLMDIPFIKQFDGSAQTLKAAASDQIEKIKTCEFEYWEPLSDHNAIYGLFVKRAYSKVKSHNDGIKQLLLSAIAVKEIGITATVVYPFGDSKLPCYLNNLIQFIDFIQQLSNMFFHILDPLANPEETQKVSRDLTTNLQTICPALNIDPNAVFQLFTENVNFSIDPNKNARGSEIEAFFKVFKVNSFIERRNKRIVALKVSNLLDSSKYISAAIPLTPIHKKTFVDFIFGVIKGNITYQPQAGGGGNIQRGGMFTCTSTEPLQTTMDTFIPIDTLIRDRLGIDAEGELTPVAKQMIKTRSASVAKDETSSMVSIPVPSDANVRLTDTYDYYESRVDQKFTVGSHQGSKQELENICKQLSVSLFEVGHFWLRNLIEMFLNILLQTYGAPLITFSFLKIESLDVITICDNNVEQARKLLVTFLSCYYYEYLEKAPPISGRKGSQCLLDDLYWDRPIERTGENAYVHDVISLNGLTLKEHMETWLKILVKTETIPQYEIINVGGKTFFKLDKGSQVHIINDEGIDIRHNPVTIGGKTYYRVGQILFDESLTITATIGRNEFDKSEIVKINQITYRLRGGSKRKVKSNKRSNKRSNMNRKTRKNRFSLLGKRTPSARMSNMRTNKTQSAKLKQRKNRTRR